MYSFGPASVSAQKKPKAQNSEALAIGSAGHLQEGRQDRNMSMDITDQNHSGLNSYEFKALVRPTNNTDYLNVSVYLAFWGYLWPTIADENAPLKGKWRAVKHRGLKEFVHHIVSKRSTQAHNRMSVRLPIL